MSGKLSKSDTTPAATPAAPAAEAPAAPAPSLFASLEEDDEFEEFVTEEWDISTAGDAATKVEALWEEKWDDDTIEDDFLNRVKAELDKVKK
ncbi:hypothetical protein H696_00900 [Fonticula alba]|uniref:26S proteasome complex subunit DSS1 n=1 Tax=Fonticula alba TaxID=691883 RepID=A0A058ZHC1_FONAL|nr:hypothetical protein H696_00900 [Fonticula alba]KCV73361.1 hypothetical protein H696_00900 [Fonticula alba]|eukprot:XP_009493062.1 hypothetical protein H696_00900 [Fonticula alba]